MCLSRSLGLMTKWTLCSQGTGGSISVTVGKTSIPGDPWAHPAPPREPQAPGVSINWGQRGTRVLLPCRLQSGSREGCVPHHSTVLLYFILFYPTFPTHINRYGPHDPGFCRDRNWFVLGELRRWELRIHSLCFAEHGLMKYAYAERWLGCNSSFWLKCCFLYVYCFTNQPDLCAYIEFLWGFFYKLNLTSLLCMQK